MSNDSKKDFNARMNVSKDMPKIVILEEEGHTIITKGTKNIKFYVKDFEKSLMEF